MASKAETNGYRKALDSRAYPFCIQKQAVPYDWCEVTGQQIRYDMTCDQYREE
jgi:hypothetical protein